MEQTIDALRHKLHTAAMAREVVSNPTCLAKFRAAEPILLRIKTYVDLALADPLATAGYQFVKNMYGSGTVDVRINEDDKDVHVTFYIRAGDYDLEDLIQNWWQNVFLFASRVAYYPSQAPESLSD